MTTIERTIIAALIRDLNKAGYLPAAFYDGEAYQMASADGIVSYDIEPRILSSQPCKSAAPDEIFRAMTAAEAIAAVDSVDEGTLHFTHRNARTWGNRGVMLILGNGEDVVSDYHCADGEPFSKVIEALYDRLNEGQIL